MDTTDTAANDATNTNAERMTPAPRMSPPDRNDPKKAIQLNHKKDDMMATRPGCVTILECHAE